MGREFLDPISLRRLVYHIKDELSKYAKRTEIPSKLSELDNDSGYITEVPDFTETDPTVPAWAKQPTKPSYTASEVGALPNTTKIPTVVSDLKNDLGYLTEYTETDPTVPEWAKQPTKPTYTADEVGALPDTTEIPSKVSQLENDNGYLTEHQDISGKADKVNAVSSENTTLSFEFSSNYNTEIRTSELISISFTFGNGEYAQDYMSGLSFDSGETPTAIDYTDSGILNWVGTDCTTYDGLSIFQPSENTHYDIVLYFNGTQFIGLVNGFVPAGGNEAV